MGPRDSLGPSSITRWAEFMKLFVANEMPKIPDSVINLSSLLYQYLADAGSAPVTQSRFANMTSVAEARAAFKRDPRVRLLMDNGAGPQGPGSIGATWDLGYSAWPPKQARATRYFLGANGALGKKPSKSGSAV